MKKIAIVTVLLCGVCFSSHAEDTMYTRQKPTSPMPAKSPMPLAAVIWRNDFLRRMKLLGGWQNVQYPHFAR